LPPTALLGEMRTRRRGIAESGNTLINVAECLCCQNADNHHGNTVGGEGYAASRTSARGNGQ
jgi:hypothetical protein